MTASSVGAEDRIERARKLCDDAMFAADPAALAAAERTLDTVEADHALARGRALHVRFLEERVEDPHELELFERAAELYRQLGDPRGEGEALFRVGSVHQVVRGDHDAAVPAFVRARELATQVGDRLTLSYVLRHLAFVEQAAGRTAEAVELMAESTRLRREIGFLPGVAANLVGLGYLTAEAGQPDRALSFIDEAATVAEVAGAHGILRWVDEARVNLRPA
ncbi:tetratricopeptide repeat protein [Micromonospora inositola]|uniref:Tetratricopeptide repeat-containing protein n=1 Tax=Micromonospora inositola TaxID=47865 RepID=A0A1C5H5B2_9ACTN|nr:tetratricopeptide repeat protein [Micromonospora inositola]SCG41077.1 hypothetical protein GA0070613_0838 [Micromonospora inositola]